MLSLGLLDTFTRAAKESDKRFKQSSYVLGFAEQLLVALFERDDVLATVVVLMLVSTVLLGTLLVGDIGFW